MFNYEYKVNPNPFATNVGKTIMYNKEYTLAIINEHITITPIPQYVTFEAK